MKTLYLFAVLLLVSCSSDDDSGCTCENGAFQDPESIDSVIIKSNIPVDCITGEYLGEQSGYWHDAYLGCQD